LREESQGSEYEEHEFETERSTVVNQVSQICSLKCTHLTAAAGRYVACWEAWKEHESDSKGLKKIEPEIEASCRKIIEESNNPDKYYIVDDIKEAVEVQHRCREYLRNIEVQLFYLEADSDEEYKWEHKLAAMKAIVNSLSDYMTKPALDIERIDLMEALLLSKKVFKDFA